MLQKSNIESIDFNRLYKEQRARSSFQPKSKADWNKKAGDFNSRVFRTPYNEAFISRVVIDPGDTLLDVGCGVGNLSIALAGLLRQVYALDFSTNMLGYLRENMQKEGVTNITPLELSWDDDWSKVPEADIVIASRSMEVDDLAEALGKMHAKARKRVYLTYKCGGSFVDGKTLDVIGRNVEAKPDYIYILNVLYTMGITASLSFIESEGRGSYFADAGEYVESTRWSLGSLNCEEEAHLTAYYESLDKDEKQYLRKPVKWAFIYWEKE